MKDPKYKGFQVNMRQGWSRVFRKRETLIAFLNEFGVPHEIFGMGRNGLLYSLKLEEDINGDLTIIF